MAGGAIGNMIAPGIGGAVGSVVGQDAHALVKGIIGFGDYQVTKNSLVYNRDAAPEFSNNNKRCTMLVPADKDHNLPEYSIVMARNLRDNTNVNLLHYYKLLIKDCTNSH
jgi:hypothetical protein